jgi:hypothetical protein
MQIELKSNIHLGLQKDSHADIDAWNSFQIVKS